MNLAERIRAWSLRKKVLLVAGILVVTVAAPILWYFLAPPRTVVVRKRRPPRVTVAAAQEMYNSGRYEEALDFCMRNRRHYSGDPEFWNFFGVTLRTMGRIEQNPDQVDEEIAAFETALKLKPDFVAAHMNLANLYWEHGRTEEAIRAFREVLRLDPEHPDHRLILDRLQEMAAATHAKSGEPDTEDTKPSTPPTSGEEP